MRVQSYINNMKYVHNNKKNKNQQLIPFFAYMYKADNK